MNDRDISSGALAVWRVRVWFTILIVIIGVFSVRLFYIEVIKHNYYLHAASNDQYKQYQVPATRGIIEAHDGDSVVPIVLNQQLFTLYADPTLVKNSTQTANKLVSVIGGSESDIESKITTKNTRYVVITHRLTSAQSSQILSFKLPGVGTQGQDYRTYPQGDLAAQVLGFVNNDGTGNYGVEQALDNQLKGKPGQLKAVTDVNGVPLEISKNNVSVQPTQGQSVVLTLDTAMQKQVQEILQQGIQNAKADSGSALILDTKTGAVKAMANFPSYNPNNYSSVTDTTVFNNASVSNPIEIGSTMKTLTTSAAIDSNSIQPNQTYYDPASWTIDGFKITNIEEDGGAGTKSLGDILNLSLNTGATWELMQMGGGQINQHARDTWHDYMVSHFLLGQATGIEQGFESSGIIPSPRIANESEDQQDLNYANTAFGQGVLISALQLGSAMSSIVNGGTYYQPHLVDQYIDPSGKVQNVSPKVLKSNVVNSKTTQALIQLMEYVVQQHFKSGFTYLNYPANYIVGGKTGTAQVADPKGGYQKDVYNGTYVGFVGGNTPQYVVVVFVIKPKIAGYAGSQAAQPIFGSIAHMLINQSYVNPKN